MCTYCVDFVETTCENCLRDPVYRSRLIELCDPCFYKKLADLEAHIIRKQEEEKNNLS